MIRLNIFKGDPTNDIIIEPHGYLLMTNNESYESSLEQVFDTLNWQYATDKKPELLFSDISTCGSGIIINIDGTSIFYLALSVGWKKFTSYSELYVWYSKNRNNHKAMLREYK